MNRNSPNRQKTLTQYRDHSNIGVPKVICWNSSTSMKLRPIAITPLHDIPHHGHSCQRQHRRDHRYRKRKGQKPAAARIHADVQQVSRRACKINRQEYHRLPPREKLRQDNPHPSQRHSESRDASPGRPSRRFQADNQAGKARPGQDHRDQPEHDILAGVLFLSRIPVGIGRCLRAPGRRRSRHRRMAQRAFRRPVLQAYAAINAIHSLPSPPVALNLNRNALLHQR